MLFSVRCLLFVVAFMRVDFFCVACCVVLCVVCLVVCVVLCVVSCVVSLRVDCCLL